MKIYEAIIDDGKEVYKSTGYAKNLKDFKNIYGGNGELIRIKDVTSEYKVSISKIQDALINANFGDTEIALVSRILEASENAV